MAKIRCITNDDMESPFSVELNNENGTAEDYQTLFCIGENDELLPIHIPISLVEFSETNDSLDIPNKDGTINYKIKEATINGDGFYLTKYIDKDKDKDKSKTSTPFQIETLIERDINVNGINHVLSKISLDPSIALKTTSRPPDCY